MRTKKVWVSALLGAVSVAACSVLPVDGGPTARTEPPVLSPRSRVRIQQKQPLAIEWDRGRDRDFLAEIQPRTLRTGRRVLIGQQGGHSSDLSPDGRHLLFAEREGLFRVIDVARMARVGGFAAGNGWPIAVQWLEPRRAVVVRANRSSANVTALDPFAGEVLGPRRTIEGTPVRSRRVGGRIVLLTQQYRPHSETAAPAGLAVVEPTGEVRTVRLERIAAGFSVPVGDRYGRSLSPALAVRGDEAIVIGTEGVIARIDLTAMEVDYPAPPRSLFRTLSSGLLSPALAKLSEGLSLWARWVDHDVLALTGTRMDVSGTYEQPHFRGSSAPIRLLDTRTWELSRWQGTGNRLVVADGMVITYDGARTEKHPLGLTAWSGTGEVLWRAMPNKHISGVTVRGAFAFVRHGYDRVLKSVVDVRNGRVLTTKQSFASVLPY